MAMEADVPTRTVAGGGTATNLEATVGSIVVVVVATVLVVTVLVVIAAVVDGDVLLLVGSVD